MNPNNVYLSNGASEGVETLFSMLINDKKDGILIPVPELPLYSAMITSYGGSILPYYLDESKNWALDIENL